MKYLVFSVFGIWLLSGCDLMHMKERLACSKLSGKPQECRALGYCNSYGEDYCEGFENSHCRSFCAPDSGGQSCQPRPEANYTKTWQCKDDPLLFSGGVLKNKAKKSASGTQLANEEKLTKQEFDSMTPNRRRALCWSNTKIPCILTWDSGLNMATCRRVVNVCEGCQVKKEAHKCWVKNLCSGVICP